MRIPTTTASSASVLSDIGMMPSDKTTGKATGSGAATGDSNPINTAASAFQASMSASALEKAATGTPFNYSGPNYDAVKATNDRAIASGLTGGFDGNEILTENDKAIIGYDPDDPASIDAANAIAGSRYSGSLRGNITSDFLSSLKDRYDLSAATIQGMKHRLTHI